MRGLKRSTFITGVAAASAPSIVRAQAKVPAEVTINYVYGIAYSPIVVLKSKGELQKLYPQTKFNWPILGNLAAIRDGIIAGTVQVGCGSAPPFLIGWDRGVPWKIFTNLCTANIKMVATDPKIKSLRDIKPADRIALPSADSIQAIQCRKAASIQLGNPHALDANMSFMAHPDGLQAMLSGQVVAVYSAPPFQQIALSKGAHVVVEGDQLFPHASFVMTYINTNFAAQYPEFTQTLFRLITESTKFIQTNKDATADFLSKDSGKISADVFREELSDKSVIFEPAPHGVIGYAQFMHQIGLIDKVPKSISELEYSGMGGVGD